MLSFLTLPTPALQPVEKSAGIALVEVIRIQALSSSFMIPMDLLSSLSGHCARAFRFCATSFVQSSLSVITHARACKVFLAVIPPWFAEVPCSETLLAKLITTPYRLHPETDLVTFGQCPIDAEVLPILSAVATQNPLFTLNFLLRTTPFCQSLCIFICMQFAQNTTKFLVDHLTFDFWLFEKDFYHETVGNVLNVLFGIFKEKPAILSPFVYDIHAFCLIAPLDLPICQQLRDLLPSEFSAEAENAVLQWATSCGDFRIALNACNVLKNHFQSSSRTKAELALNTISIIAHLLRESQCTDFDEELALMAALLEVAFLSDSFNTRLATFVITFIGLTAPTFAKLFNAAIPIFTAVVIPRISEFSLLNDAIFFTLISAHLSDSTVLNRIFSILLLLLRQGFHFPNLQTLFFALLPYLEFASDDELLELSSLLDSRISKFRVSFESVVLDLYGEIPVDHAYLVLTFFMNCVAADCDQYFPLVFRVCRLIVAKLGQWSPLSVAVFNPLVDRINGFPCRLDQEMQFISAVGKRKSAPPVETPPKATFPVLPVEFSFEGVMSRPIGDKFAETRTLREIESAFAKRRKSAFQRAKQAFAAMPEVGQNQAVESNESNGRARIATLLKRRKDGSRTASLSRGDLFAIREVERGAFRPAISEFEAFAVDGFPTILC